MWLIRVGYILWLSGRGWSQCPLVCHCDDHDKTAQCVAQSLDAVPENLPWFVQELSISENLIKRIPKDAFPKKNNIQDFVGSKKTAFFGGAAYAHHRHISDLFIFSWSNA